MTYIYIAIAAYILFAVNGVIDKFLLTRAVRHPIAYAFYIGITGFFTWVLAPFGLKFLSPVDLMIAIIGGACFIIALYFLYVATQATSISRLLPIEGGFVPLFTLGFAYLFLGERLTGQQDLAFVFLVCGAVLISLKHDASGWHPRALGNAIIAALLFALHFTLTKYIFDRTNFVSGLIWTRHGFVLVSLCFLIPRKTRCYIFEAPRETSAGNKVLYYGARVSGGLAGLLQNYAIAIGSVTLVNALQGTQYAFLLILAVILSVRFPKILKEDVSSEKIILKVLSILLISAGLYFLAT